MPTPTGQPDFSSPEATYGTKPNIAHPGSAAKQTADAALAIVKVNARLANATSDATSATIAGLTVRAPNS